MTKPDYSALDDILVSFIARQRYATFGQIQDGCKDSENSVRDFRVLDRRLQALRKAGRITFAPVGYTTAKRWQIAQGAGQ